MAHQNDSEEETRDDSSLPASLGDVPELFFDTATPDSCVLAVFHLLPSITSPEFSAALDRQIEIAEASVGIVTTELTTQVLQSQNAIFDVTSQFIDLNEHAIIASNFIESIRNQVTQIREQTLNPLVSVLTQIRDLRRDAKALTVLHFGHSLRSIYEVLNGPDLVWSAHTLIHAREFLANDSAVYDLGLLHNFVGIQFEALSEIQLPVPINLTVGELKRLSCVRDVLSEIEVYAKVYVQRIDARLIDLAHGFNQEEYALLVISYCVVCPEPPMARVLFEHFSMSIREQSLGYFETKSNDLPTLFRFMETGYTLLTSFKSFFEFHTTHDSISSIIDEVLRVVDLSLLEKLRGDQVLFGRVGKLVSGFEQYYGQLTHVVESNVLQFLSRLNCINLDPLSFIKLTRALHTFHELLNCVGIAEWINLTAQDFFTRYASVAMASVRSAVAADSWVPLPVDLEFVQFVCTLPLSESVFETAVDFDPCKMYASSSVVTLVRIIHSLVCLSLELDSEVCFTLVIHVSAYFVLLLLNAFCSPVPLIESGRLHQRFHRFFDPIFVQALEQFLKFIPPGNSLLDQKPPGSRMEAILMEMITATDGFALLRWYLQGIRRAIDLRAPPSLTGYLSSFFTSILTILLPQARINLSAINGRHFISLKKLKLELVASNWVVTELRIEHHDFTQSAGAAFQRLDKALATIQAPHAVSADIWAGAWLHVRAVLISAFGSVRLCNAFGRSLMTGDTRAVSTSFTRYAKREVDPGPILEFINAFFYSPAEFSTWIECAIPRYKAAYVANLVRTGLSGKLSQKDSKDLLAKIDAIVAAPGA
jgi:hypothetical protein